VTFRSELTFEKFDWAVCIVILYVQFSFELTLNLLQHVRMPCVRLIFLKRYFSKDSSIVILYVTFRSELTFEKFDRAQARAYALCSFAISQKTALWSFCTWHFVVIWHLRNLTELQHVHMPCMCLQFLKRQLCSHFYTWHFLVSWLLRKITELQHVRHALCAFEQTPQQIHFITGVCVSQKSAVPSFYMQHSAARGIS